MRDDDRRALFGKAIMYSANHGPDVVEVQNPLICPLRPKGCKILQFDCIAEGVFMNEPLRKAGWLVVLGIALIVGGFIFAAAVVGFWLAGTGKLAP